MSTPEYKRGKDGTPVPIVGGVKKAVSKFKRPAHGTVLLQRTQRASSTIISPTAEADAGESTWVIDEKGSDWYAFNGCQCTFQFEVGEEVILVPPQATPNGAVAKPGLVAEPGSEDEQGYPMRCIAQMKDVLASVHPKPKKSFDA